MNSYESIKKQISYTYHPKDSEELEKKRKHNIEEFRKIIDYEKKNGSLANGEKEERIIIYTTNNNEKICIQFPGKESSKKDKKEFDFRPLIIDNEGNEIKNLLFADMWDILEELKHDSELLELLSAVFYMMGHMTFHKLTKMKCECELYTVNNKEYSLNKTDKDKIEINWYSIPNKKMEVINKDANTLDVYDFENKKKQTISLEAFLYFYDLLMLNEDIKYNYKEINDNQTLSKRGRVPTSNTMLLIILAHLQLVRMSICLQRLVNGRGVINCSKKDYSLIPNDLVQLIDKDYITEKILDLLKKHDSKQNSNITINHITYSIKIKNYNLKIAVLSHSQNKNKPEVKQKLEENNWNVFYIEDFVNDETFTRLQTIVDKYETSQKLRFHA